MKPALLIIGILARNPDFIAQGERLLTQEFGPILLRSPQFSWNFSRYYEKEMGKDLFRCWVCHQPIIDPGDLIRVKKCTVAIEGKLRDRAGKRPLNLDPGILTLHNFVLTTHKDYAHRIYLGQGVYAEVTLIYHQGKFQPLPWTYPDYKTEIALHFLTECRNFLLNTRQG